MSNKTTVIGSELSAALDAKNKRIAEIEAECSVWKQRAEAVYKYRHSTIKDMNDLFITWFDKDGKALEMSDE